ARACMECLSEKLSDRYPIGKTAVVGNEVIPVGSTGKAASSPSGGSAPDELMDPRKYLTAFDYGEVTQLADATSQREYRVVAEDKEIEIAEGIKFPAWVYNGFLPGPTLRATVGDRIIIHFENKGSKPHTMHFHGIDPANMDGVFEVVPEGKTFTYDFIAEPFGVFPYHRHMMPLRKHVSRGLFGTLIVDPIRRGRRRPRRSWSCTGSTWTSIWRTSSMPSTVLPITTRSIPSKSKSARRCAFISRT
ncbi:MAG: multicopper oxidase domain-containing protein, partial [Terrimicrobiaceae bacterium]